MTQYNVDMQMAEVGEGSAFRLPPAAWIRRKLAAARVPLIRLVGPPGAGKTTLIEATLRVMNGPRHTAVLVAHPAAERDAGRIAPHCGQVVTMESPIATASRMQDAIRKVDLERMEMILAETSGGLAPVDDLGQDFTVAVFSAAGGDDKAAEYAGLIRAASAVVLTKTDLAGLVKFDSRVFRSDLHHINPAAEVIEVSSTTGTGMGHWHLWLERARLLKRAHHGNPSATDGFLG